MRRIFLYLRHINGLIFSLSCYSLLGFTKLDISADKRNFNLLIQNYQFKSFPFHFFVFLISERLTKVNQATCNFCKRS